MAMTSTITTTITCDRDGQQATTTTPEATVPEGWLAVVIADGPAMGTTMHYCPDCAAAVRASMQSTQGGSS
jgi:hypothetical protein